MGPKESLFRNTLIPTGQLAELTLCLPLAMAEFQGKRDKRGLRAMAIWELLNLAAAYTAHCEPYNEPRLASIEALVRSLREALLEVFASFGQRRSNVVERIWDDKSLASLLLRAELRKAFGRLDAQLVNLAGAMYSAVGYQKSAPHKWRDRVCKLPTVLTPGKCISKWRTLVRNSPQETWLATALLAAGVQSGAPLKLSLSRVLRQKPFRSSTEGRKRAAELMAAMFQSAENSKTPAEMKTAARVPEGVAVASLADGTLRVTAQFDASVLLSDTLRLKLIAAGTTAPAAVAAILEPKTCSKHCDLTSLKKTVAEVEKWLKQQKAGGKDAVAAVSEWADDAQWSALREKLNKTFTPKERKLLAKLLAVKKA